MGGRENRKKRRNEKKKLYFRVSASFSSQMTMYGLDEFINQGQK